MRTTEHRSVAVERLPVKEALTMMRFKPLSIAPIARTIGLAFLALSAIAAGAGAADLPVRYTLEARPFLAVASSTLLTFDLYSDPTCASLMHTASVPVGDIPILSRLSQLTPRGDARRPRAVELSHTLTGVPAGGPRYLVVSGPGVLPVPATAACQAQAAGGTGSATVGGPFKRTKFAFIQVPFTAPGVILGILGYTSPVSGTALLRARGYCNMAPLPGANNQVVFAIGATPETALAGGFVENWGLINIPPGAGNGLYQEMWSAEQTLPVTAGQPTGAYLVARKEAGNYSVDCSGSFTVEIVSSMS